MSDYDDEQRFGIAISGGGHRATAWALGALLYLVDVGANRNVAAIASVSGGSLANAFVASRSAAFSDIPESDETFEGDVAMLAREIAGRPAIWWSLVGAYVAVLAAGVGLIALQGLAAWWQAGILWAGWLGLASVVGPKAEGTLWSSRLMWLYMGILVPLLVGTISIWWWNLWWGWRALLFAGAFTLWAVVFAQRGVVAGLAFSQTVCHPCSGRHHNSGHPCTTNGRRRLADIHDTVQHVFCATEMHAGQHAYFSADFVYSQGFGIGVPGNLKLHTAVQASANFPGAFPLRLLRARQFDFVLGRRGVRNKWLVLTDGGVFDNMADSWFLELSQRTGYLREQLKAARQVSKPDQPMLMRGHERDLKDRLEALDAAFPSRSDRYERPGVLIVLNGAPSERWTRLGQVWIPAIGELLGFAKVTKVQYNNSTSTRSRELISRFENSSPHGVLVTIEEDPSWVPQKAFAGAIEYGFYSCPEQMESGFISLYGEDIGDVTPEHLEEACKLMEAIPDAYITPDDRSRLVGRMRRSLATLDHLREHVLRVEAEESAGLPRSLRSLSLANREIGTHLNPLGKEKTARLLFHAYVQTMATLHTLFGEPFALLGPDRASFRRFEALVGLTSANGDAAMTRTGERPPAPTAAPAFAADVGEREDADVGARTE